MTLEEFSKAYSYNLPKACVIMVVEVLAGFSEFTTEKICGVKLLGGMKWCTN